MENTVSSLHGRVIAISETRELDVLANMLERRGATVLRYPLVSIMNAPDPAPILNWLRAFNNGSCDDLILYTGEGLRRLLGTIEQHAPELRAPFIAALAQVRRIVRGPKPTRVLHELGLKPDHVATPATTAGLIELLTHLQPSVAGRRVGVQWYGDAPNTELSDWLNAAGAQVLPVAPYVYADHLTDERVLELIDVLEHGKADTLALTSASQVERLFEIATRAQRIDALKRGLTQVVVAAVGPIAASALAAHGIRADIVPTESYFMKPLVHAIIERIGTHP